MAVFFDVEKAYDMLWKDGLRIKMHLMGIGGKIFTWIMDFLDGRTIQVKVGTEISRQYIVKWNATGECSKSNLIYHCNKQYIWKYLNGYGKVSICW